MNWRVVDWGSPNSTELVDTIFEWGGRIYPTIMEVPAWRMFRVRTWITNNRFPTRFATINVWRELEPHWVDEQRLLAFLRTWSGVADRWKWEIERWVYTAEDGWQPSECMT